MKSHDIKYKVIGNTIQLVEIELLAGQTVVAESGSMMYMRDNIDFETKMGDGADESFLGKLFSAGKRMMIGESIFLTHFTNRGVSSSSVAFSSPYPGTIMPIDLGKTASGVIVQKEAFLCAAFGTQISIAFTKRLGAGFFGGEGFVLERLNGDGMAFIHACGTIVEHELTNETLRVDTSCIVGFEPQINYDIRLCGNLKSAVFGGEGLFLATLSGTGKVWLQSMPLQRLIKSLTPNQPKAKEKD